MATQQYLTLRLIRLKTSEEYSHSPNGLSFVFPKTGTGKHVCGNETHSLGPGDALVLDGTAGGKLCGPNRGELVFARFSLSFENLLPLFATNEIPLLEGVANAFKRPRFYPARSPIAAECHRLLEEVTPQFNLGHRSQLLRIAAAILTPELEHANGPRAGFVRAEDHMIKIFENISNKELLNLSADDLAARFSCSRRHLNRLFHQHFGRSLATLRMEMRLLKAVSLLRNPNTKITLVAEECGFNYLNLFNSCFKRRFGHSPGQWRKRNIEAKGPPGRLVADGLKCPLKINGLCPLAGQTPNPVAPTSPARAKDTDSKIDLGLAQAFPPFPGGPSYTPVPPESHSRFGAGRP